jgi:hypothetical protein
VSDLTCREAGLRGGLAILARLGPAHFRAIGALARRDPAQQRAAALRGGETTRARHGDGFYARIATLGGLAVLRRYGTEHYRAMGRRSQARRRTQEAVG